MWIKTPASEQTWRSALALAACTLFACAVYLMGLWSLYAPSNGDEMVYLHIARLTHESGQWLPLVSDLQTPSGSEMRNTKPPLLFWQAMWAGDVFGWNLFALRLPYVLQTLLCAAVVGWLAYALSSPRWGGSHAVTGGTTLVSDSLPPSPAGSPPRGGHLGAGILAAFLYLAFFSTYRYGRPALPSSTESLFLFGMVAIVVAKLDYWLARPWKLGLLAGLLMIPALLVKSFVLVVPVGLWLLMLKLIGVRPQLIAAVKAPLLATALGLTGFALWFALDPNPQAVWREFIIGENFSTKFSEQRSDSLFAIWLAPLLNAGLLAPLIIGLLLVAWRGRSNTTPAQKALWLWVLAWLVVFSLPSQRSARYVIPIMPSVAVLIAMYAQEIAAKWWRMTLGLLVLSAFVLIYVTYQLDLLMLVQMLIASGFCGLVIYCFGKESPQFKVALAGLSVLLLISVFTMSSYIGKRFYWNDEIVNQTVLVPQRFNAEFEKYIFILPTTKITVDKTNPNIAFEVRSCKLEQGLFQDCRGALPAEAQIGDRRVFRSRHDPKEISWDALINRLNPLLLEYELLLKVKSTSESNQ